MWFPQPERHGTGKKSQAHYERYVVSLWFWKNLQHLAKSLCTLSTMMRRRLHSRRYAVTLASTFVFSVLVYHLTLTTVSRISRARRATKTSPSARFLSETIHADVNESTIFTEHLWYFKNSDAERIYLYDKVLSEHKWHANHEFLASFRQELNANTNVTTDRHLVLTQSNVQPGQVLKSYISSKYIWTASDIQADEEFIATLPKESPIAGKRYNRCAVVGNSGSLKNASCGSEIDGMDFVFRCNGAPILPFAEDAGLRTDFISFNPSILFKDFGGLQNESMINAYIEFMNQYKSIVWYPCFGSRRLVDPCLQAISYRDRIDSQLVIGYPDHYVQFWEFWKRRGLKKRPSTGLYLINVAVTICEEIHLYGFWPFPVAMRGGNFSEIAYHYFNAIPFTSHHSSDIEFRILVQLHMLGVANLHTGSCKL